MNLLHLSDIHYPVPVPGTNFDLNARTRSECALTLHKWQIKHGRVDYIAISGDVAARGNEEEYEHAAAWLDELCGAAGIPLTNVLVVPGNHDVDRGAVNSSVILQTLHESLRTSPSGVGRRNSWLRIMADRPAIEALYSPLRQYNEFASRYKCSTTPHGPAWNRRVVLDDEYDVEFIGLNSALLSDENDSQSHGRLYLAPHQTYRALTPGVIAISLCHHPIDWLYDADDVSRILRRRFALQIFGHKHDAGWDDGGESSVIRAGALQPEDDGATQPEFNFIQITREGSSTALSIRLHRYRWEREYQAFTTVNALDGTPFVSLRPDISRFQRSGADLERHIEVNAGCPIEAEEKMDKPFGEKRVARANEAAQQLIFAFHALRPTKRNSVLRTLGIGPEEDDTAFDGASVERYVQRASDSGQLGDLWRLTHEALGETTQSNPFQER